MRNRESRLLSCLYTGGGADGAGDPGGEAQGPTGAAQLLRRHWPAPGRRRRDGGPRGWEARGNRLLVDLALGSDLRLEQEMDSLGFESRSVRVLFF